MKRLLVLVSVALLALLAGALVTGRPQTVQRDIGAAEIPPSTSTTTTTPPTTSTATSSSTTTTVTTTTTPATTVTPTTTTSPPTTEAAAVPSTTSAATTEPAPTQPVITEPATTLVPQSDIAVLVGNSSNTFMLASRVRQQLFDMGYAFVSSTVGTNPTADTMIYFAPGREGEARRLAEQLGASADLVAPRPDQPVVRSSLDFDVLLLLGNDWEDVTNLQVE